MLKNVMIMLNTDELQVFDAIVGHGNRSSKIRELIAKFNASEMRKRRRKTQNK